LRWQALIEYDGTEFGGWQRQPQGRSVQRTLEEAVRALTGEWTTVVGAGRTDAGVHAIGQVAHFDTEWHRPADRLRHALNAHLPRDVVVRAVAEAGADFHARHSAERRLYAYRIWNGRVRTAMSRRTSWHVARGLDTARMAEGAAWFAGEHDFGGFGQPTRPGGSTVRRIDDCRVTRRSDWVVVRVSGNSFLRHQVRRMVGLLAEIGMGREEPASIAAALGRGPGAPIGRSAPARGLVLVAVEYDRTMAFDPDDDGSALGDEYHGLQDISSQTA
jgi:tRNA pseudouridine38-40 synthase